VCYEASIASAGGDDTTLTKSFIISLENAATNWYAKLQLRSITSWGQLKDKFLVNFWGFLELSTKEDFFVMPTIWKGNNVKFLSEVSLSQSTSPGGLRRASHNASHKSTACKPATQSFSESAHENTWRMVWQFPKIQQVGGVTFSHARAAEESSQGKRKPKAYQI
jgi:hypothetical protein